MTIPELKSRNQKSQGTRYRDESSSFYHTKIWKDTRNSFREGFTVASDGFSISNKYCIMCYEEHKMKIPGSQCDHVQAIKLGGDRTSHSNLRTLCNSHHAKKSANEGKNG